MQWQGSYGRKVGKETHHLRISQAFTRVDYRKAVNKENLGKPKLAQRSLHCKDAKPLRFLLQVLYSFMRRVASVFSTGRGFQNQVIDSMDIMFILYRDRFGTKFYNMAADHSLSRQLKTNPSPRNPCQVYEV